MSIFDVRLLTMFDGLKSLVNGLINQRNALNSNVVVNNQRLSLPMLRDVNKNGLYRRIVSLKSGHSTKSGFNFDDDASQEFYKSRLVSAVRFAVNNMIGYGRGVIVLISPNEPLSEPLQSNKNLIIKSFGSDMITAVSASFDLLDERYMKPDFYVIREKQVHHSRVIDFSYEKPPEIELPLYFYGGMSEAELIYPQILADGIVERAVPSILEKSATMIYKVAGFKAALTQKKEQDIIRHFATLENMRSIYGAGIIDKEDDMQVHNQSLSNLQESDLITLRRIALVSAIPLTILLGEGAKGLNNDNDTEKQVFNEMIEALQTQYILPPLGDLMELMGYKRPSIKIGQNISALDKIKLDGMILDNAAKLFNMSEDYERYLNENGITNTNEDFT